MIDQAQLKLARQKFAHGKFLRKDEIAYRLDSGNWIDDNTWEFMGDRVKPAQGSSPGYAYKERTNGLIKFMQECLPEAALFVLLADTSEDVPGNAITEIEKVYRTESYWRIFTNREDFMRPYLDKFKQHGSYIAEYEANRIVDQAIGTAEREGGFFCDRKDVRKLAVIAERSLRNPHDPTLNGASLMRYLFNVLDAQS